MQRLIQISLRTLDWLEGEHVWFDIKLVRGSAITVSFGDGKQVLLRPVISDCTRVEHRYANKGETYNIEFLSETPECLIGLVDGTWETKVGSVKFENCSGLKLLRYHNVQEFDFSGCPNLEALDCRSYAGNTIDLTTLTKLKQLDIRYAPNLQQLNISKNNDIDTLDIEYCQKLKKVAVSNNSKLKILHWDITDLNSHSKEWLLKTIEANDGKITDYTEPITLKWKRYDCKGFI